MITEDYLNKEVVLFFNKAGNKGVIKALDDNMVMFEGDTTGLIKVLQSDINSCYVIEKVDPIYIYACKNNLGCKGIRYIGVDTKKFPCKYLTKYSCELLQLGDFNILPIHLRKAFLDGMHTKVPIDTGEKNG